MALSAQTYEEAYTSFRWRIPERFNIAEAACDRHVGSNKTALIYEAGAGVSEMTFEHLQ
jgi:acetyl-CoA synthetase